VISNYLMLAIGALALVLALAVILTHKRSEDIKDWMVGAAAGLDFAQVVHVHVFTIVVVFWLLTSSGVKRRKVSAVLIAFLAAAAILASTAFIGPLAVDHTLALQLIALAISAAIIGIKAAPEAMQRMAHGLLAVCLFSASWAILQKFGLVPLTQFNRVEGAGRVMGIYREPDWLGLFCSIGIITTLRLEFSRLRKITFLSILGIALLFSLARASIIALAVVAVVAIVANLLTNSDTARRSRNRQVVLTFLSIVTVVLVLSPSLSNRIITRFQTGFTSSGQDVGAHARTQQVQSLNLLAHSAPWYGDGLSASGRVLVTGRIYYGAVPISNGVSTDWVLGWWVDGQYLAIPLIAMFCLLALRSVNRLGGQLLLVVLVTSLVSDAVMLPITWFAIGICLAGTIPADDAKRSHELDLESLAPGLVAA
jgi:hypothetical protein